MLPRFCVANEFQVNVKLVTNVNTYRGLSGAHLTLVVIDAFN